MFLGELSLDGALRHTTGILPLVALARARRVPAVVVPAADAAEAALVEEVRVIPARTLAELARQQEVGDSITIDAVDEQAAREILAELYGLAGADCLYGEDGGDRITAGDGDDRAEGGNHTLTVVPDNAAAGSQRTVVYTKEGNWLRHTMESHGEKVEYVFSTPYPAYVFPLDAGKSWSVRVPATVPATGQRRRCPPSFTTSWKATSNRSWPTEPTLSRYSPRPSLKGDAGTFFIVFL